MADRPILRIEQNDSDSRFRDKCNSNFLQLSSGARNDGTIKSIIQETQQQIDVNAVLSTAFNQSNPVGTVIFTNSLNDIRLQRGTWIRHENVFIYAAGDTYALNATGGEEKHTLTAEELPVITVQQEAHSHLEKATETVNLSTGTLAVEVPTSSTAQGTEATAVNKPFGGGNPHNNMPPFLAKYCFERTA